jgi:hypothetical protein
MDGFWIVQFEGIEGGGGGVAVLLRGNVYGGDSAYHYTGTYLAEGGVLTAKVLVHQFLPGIGNVLGIEGDFNLSLVGNLDGAAVTGTASLVGVAGAGIAFKLKRISDVAL